MLTEFAWDPGYKVSAIKDVMTPALVVYPEIIASTLSGRWGCWAATLTDGECTSRRLSWGTRAHDGRTRHCNFKCATTLELIVACQCGRLTFSWPTHPWAQMRAGEGNRGRVPASAHFRFGREQRTGAPMARQPDRVFRYKSRHEPHGN